MFVSSSADSLPPDASVLITFSAAGVCLGLRDQCICSHLIIYAICYSVKEGFFSAKQPGLTLCVSTLVTFKHVQWVLFCSWKLTEIVFKCQAASYSRSEQVQYIFICVMWLKPANVFLLNIVYLFCMFRSLLVLSRLSFYLHRNSVVRKCVWDKPKYFFDFWSYSICFIILYSVKEISWSNISRAAANYIVVFIINQFANHFLN